MFITWDDFDYKKNSKRINEEIVNILRRIPLIFPLMERYPLRLMSDAPSNVRKIASSGLYPAINDGNAVYYSIEIFRSWVDSVVKADLLSDQMPVNVTKPASDFVWVYFWADEIAQLVIQQYLHLLLQHTRPTRYSETEKIDPKMFRIATEIEVNRSHLIQRNSLAYTALPNTDLFPETRDCLSLRATYAALMSNQQKDSQDAGGDGQDQSQDSPTSHQNAQNEASNQKDGSNTDSGSQSPQNAQNEANNKKLSKAQENAIKNMTPQDGQFDTGDSLIGDPGMAYTLRDQGVEKLSQVVYARWHNRLIKKQMRKLRTTIQGKISRRKRKTFARPSRRPIDTNSKLIKKGFSKDLSGKPKILIAVDMSSSMNQTTQEEMVEVVANTFDDLGRPTKDCYICLFNDNIIENVPLRQYANILGRYKPKYGTNYGAVVQLANMLDVDVVMEIGDGEQLLNSLKEYSKFVNAGRKWYDVIVSDVSLAIHTHINDDLFHHCERHIICTSPKVAEVARAYCLEHPEYKKFFA